MARNSPPPTLTTRTESWRALKIGEREEKIGRNPCDLMHAPRLRKPEPAVLDIQEVKEVLKKGAPTPDAED